MTGVLSKKEAIIMAVVFISLFPIVFSILKSIFKLSMKTIKVVLGNSFSGLVLLYVLNLIGFAIPLTIKNAIIVSILGIPGLFMLGVV